MLLRGECKTVHVLNQPGVTIVLDLKRDLNPESYTRELSNSYYVAFLFYDSQRTFTSPGFSATTRLFRNDFDEYSFKLMVGPLVF